MGFHHGIIFGEINKEDKELIKNPPLLVKKYDSLKLPTQEYLTCKGGHPMGWEILFNEGMFFTNQKEIKSINDEMYAYFFGIGDEILKKAHEIADFLKEKTKDCNEKIKEQVDLIIEQMFDVVSEMGELGRSYGLEEEDTYVLLNISQGMEFNFNWNEDNTVAKIDIDLEERYSKIKTKEYILELLQRNFTPKSVREIIESGSFKEAFMKEIKKQ